MKLQIFAVFDRKTAQYGTPMFLVNAGQAIRSFSDEINKNDEQSILFKHPDDFDLYELGIFDTDEGIFNCSVPRAIAIGKDLVIAKS